MYNKVTLVGNLGKDPEIRVTQSGANVANFTVATTETYQKDGQLNKETTWNNVVAWGKTAENVGHYLKKGSKVMVNGTLKNRSYEDKNGNTKYVTEIRADMINGVIFLDPKNNTPKQETTDGRSGFGGQEAPSIEDIPF